MSARAQAPNQPKGTVQKFGVAKNPFELEAELDAIQPLDSDERDQILKICNQMISSGTMSRGEIAALEVFKVSVLTENFKSAAKAEFQRDFWRWLLGRGTEKDHKNTPWYRASLADDREVSLYVDQFVAKFHEFKIMLKLLSMRRPVGIKQTYLYYKYLVKKVDPDQTNFLQDWQILISEFDEGRKYPQEHRDPSKGPHEVSPWGDARKKIAKEYYNNNPSIKNFTSGWVGGPNIGPDNPDDPDDPNATPQRPRGGPRGPKPDTGKGKEEDDDDDDDDDEDFRGQQLQFQQDMLTVLREIKAGQTDTAKETAAAIKEVLETPEKRIKGAESDEGQVELQIEALEKRLTDLTKTLESERASRQSTDKTTKMIEDQQKQLALLEQTAENSRLTIDNITAELKASREARSKEGNEIVAELKNLKPLGDSDATKKFQSDFADFMSRFAEYRTAMDKRQAQIENNLQEPGPLPTVQIKELTDMVTSLKAIEAEIKTSNSSVLALKSSTDAAMQAQKAEALRLIGESDGKVDVIVDYLKNELENQKNREIEFNKSVDLTFKGLRENLGSNFQSIETRIGSIIEKLPSSDPTMTLEWKNSIENTLDKLAMTQASVADTQALLKDKSTQSTLLLKDRQDVLEKMVVDATVAANQALTAADTRNLLENFKRVAAEKFSDQDEVNQVLRAQLQQAGVMYDNIKSQWLQQQHSMNYMGQQIHYLTRENQAAAQAFAQQRQADEVRLREQQKLWLREILAIEASYKQNEAEPMEIDDQSDEENTDTFTLEERQFLQDAPFTLFLEGPPESPAKRKEYAAKQQEKKENFEADYEKLSPVDKKLYEKVINIEKELMVAVNQYGRVITEELRHIIEMKSAKAQVLRHKLSHYQKLINDWEQLK